MTITTDVRNRDEENGAAAASSLKSGDRVVVAVEMKERRNLKVFVFLLATAFMVLVGAILRGETQPHYKGLVSTSLFEKRSLQGLLGLCQRAGGFQPVDFYTTLQGIPLEEGKTKRYTTVVPKSTKPYVVATYNPGQMTILTSYMSDYPTGTGSGDVTCVSPGGVAAGSATIMCTLRDNLDAKRMYIWVVASVTTTFQLKIGDTNYVS